MSRIVVIKGGEGNLSNTGPGNTFFSSTLIKLNVVSDAKINIHDSSNTLIGNTTFTANGNGGTHYVSKSHTDKISVVSGVVTATPIGFAD